MCTWIMLPKLPVEQKYDRSVPWHLKRQLDQVCQEVHHVPSIHVDRVLLSHLQNNGGTFVSFVVFIFILIINSN